MFRLIGFLLGSALSVGVFLLVFGLPELANKTASPEDKPTQSAETKPDPELPAPEELAAKLLDTIKHEFKEIKAELAATQPPTASEEPEESLQVPVEDAIAIVDDMPSSTLEAPELELQSIGEFHDETRWHAFWNPFRSQIAANGFVTQLESVTGLDYQVVRVKPGEYQVAFAYVEETERAMKLSQIESATGLDLTGPR